MVITAPIRTDNETIGTLQVHKTDDHNHSQRSYFLDEEKQLIDVVAERLGHIIERLQSHTMLQNRRYELEMALSAGNMGTWTYNISNKKFSIGQNHNLLLGTLSETFNGSIDNVLHYLHPDDRDHVITGFTETLNKGVNFAATYRVVQPDGNVRWFYSTGKPLLDESSKPITILGLSQDITDRKSREIEIDNTNLKMKLAMDSANEGVWEWDLTNNSIAADDTTLYMLGYTEENIIPEMYQSTWWFEQIHPDDMEYVRDTFSDYISGNSAHYSTEFRIKRYSGDYIWVSSTCTIMIKTETGEPSYVVGIHRNINYMKTIEENLRESEDRFRGIVEKSPAGIAIVNDNSLFTYVNNELCRITGYNQNELIGRNFSSILSEDSRNIAQERYRRRQQGEKVPDRYTFSFIRKNGDRRIGEVQSITYTDVNGRKNTIIQVLDITERKAAEDALLVEIQEADILREKAEIAKQEKELLLKEVHHRIKNNMCTIMSLLSLQSGTANDASTKDALKEAQGRIQSMMVLYDKLYRSESLNGLTLNDYLTPLVKEIVQSFPESSRICLEADVAPIDLSARKLFPLGLIINELISNTMKHAFTDNAKGTIRITASSGNGKVLITFEDNGIGLRNDFQPSSGFG
ncbi:MAG TPA: PAS domain S-box protein, partial [Spirochaetota bacterium]|nr:PAS domain S-box protein [Spirochaetota bacterium]